MSGKAFYDTNLFIYSFDAASPGKKRRAMELIGKALVERNAVISWQVVQEFLNVGLGKFAQPLSESEAREYLETVLWPLCEVFPSRELYARAVALRRETQWGFYDCLMVAAALQANCQMLYSEDLQDGRKIEGLKVMNPFKA